MPLVGLPGSSQGLRDALSGTAARVCHVLSHKLLQRLAIKLAALRLVYGRLVGVHTASRQLLGDDLVRTGHAARRVYILYTEQPFAVMRPCIKPTSQRRNQRAGM